MRILFTGLGRAMAVGLILLGIAGTSGAARAQELRIIFPSLWNEGIDPMLTSSNGSIGLAAIYDDLIGVTADGTELSKDTGIANDWSMSADGKEWTIKIRKGVMFHGGFGELTADDVKFNLDRLASERSVAQEKAYFKNQIAKVEVLDANTVKVTGSKPIPDFPTIVSAMRGSVERFMVSKKAAQSMSEEAFAAKPIGSGPYEVAGRVGGQYMQFKAVANHWRIGKPKYDGLRFLSVPEEESGIAMIQRGDADMMQVSRANIRRLEQAKVKVIVQEGLNSVTVFLDDQFVNSVPVHNPKVREALNLAIDRNAIAQSLYDGYARPMGTYYTQFAVLKTMGYDGKADLYPYDPAKAKKLLAEAGYPNGFDIDVYLYAWPGVPEGPDTLQAITGMWAQIGVRPKIISTEYGVMRAKMLKGDMAGATGFLQAPARPWQGEIGVYRIFMHSTGAFNHVKIPELDAILDAAAQALDPAVAMGKLAEAMHFIRNNHLAVPVLEFDQAYAVTPKLANWKPVFLPQNLNYDSMFKR